MLRLPTDDRKLTVSDIDVAAQSQHMRERSLLMSSLIAIGTEGHDVERNDVDEHIVGS